MAEIIVKKRNLTFDFNDAVILTWMNNNILATQLMNIISSSFPESEKYFIRSVKKFLKVAPPEKQEEINNFIAQEAFHAREHARLNKKFAKYLNIKKIDDFNYKFFRAHDKLFSPLMNLAIVAGYEHYTAIMSERMLANSDLLLEGAEPEYKQLSVWHMIEESEHKAVVFDLLASILKDHKYKFYFYRCFGLVIASLSFALGKFSLVREFIWNFRKNISKEDIKDARRRFKPVRKGTLIRVLRWFKPSFHPWDDDNSEIVERHKKQYGID